MMSAYETRDPVQAKELLEREPDCVYLDVRTTLEFEQGHVPGAFNVPIAVRDEAGRMVANPDFERVCEATFQRKDQALVVGCAAGIRSARACEALAARGYTRLVNLSGGYCGLRDASGALVVLGWEQHGFETSVRPHPERTYTALCAHGIAGQEG